MVLNVKLLQVCLRSLMSCKNVPMNLESLLFMKNCNKLFIQHLMLYRTLFLGETLWSPSSPTVNFFKFAPLDDVVMGGASSSTIDNNTGMWTGTVTDANNGGFVGIRSIPFQNDLSFDLSDCEGIELRLRLGEGRRFKFVVRDSKEFNGICWTTAFDVLENGGGGGLAGIAYLFNGKGEGVGRKDGGNIKSTVIRIPFGTQIPTIFANTVSGKTFDVRNVVGFQLAYSKFEFDGQLNKSFSRGNFALQILELRTY